MYLLDTVALSELRRASNRRANPGFTQWAHSVHLNRLYLSAISVLELEQGVLLKERSDPAQGQALRDWLDSRLLPAFEGRVVHVSDSIAKRAAAFSIPDPAPLEDAIIGATAAELAMSVVTRNERDFRRLPGVDILNPWNG